MFDIWGIFLSNQDKTLPEPIKSAEAFKNLSSQTLCGVARGSHVALQSRTVPPYSNVSAESIRPHGKDRFL